MRKKLQAKQSKKVKTPKLDLENLTFDQIEQQNHQENLLSCKPQNPNSSPIQTSKKAAWIDKNDQEVSIDISKIARLRKLRKTDEENVIKGDEYQERLQEFYAKKLNNMDFFKWGSVSTENEPENTTNFKEFLNRDIDLFDEKREELPSLVISINKLGNLQRKDEHNAVVQTIDFHPNNEIFLSAGYDKMMKLYSVKKEENYGVYTDTFKKNLKVLKRIYLENFPMKKCRFLSQKNEILCCGLKKHLISYDLTAEKTEKFASNLFTSYFDKNIDNFSISPDEKYIVLNNDKGDLIMLSGKNKEYLFHLKSNDPCTTSRFTNDGKFLFTAGSSGKIYQWDLNKRMVYDCFGTSSINCLDLSYNDNYLAAGGLNGIVNIYDKDQINQKMNRTALKEIDNLTTGITGLEINKKGEMMVIASKWKKNAVRLVNLASRTVFSNWPNLKTKLQFVTEVKMSENCKYMVLGNDEGNVFLYNFKHYN